MANELVDWFNAVDLTYCADLRDLNELNLQVALKEEISELRFEPRQELIGSRAGSRSGLHGLRTDLINWMFDFWVTTVLALAGLMGATA